MFISQVGSEPVIESIQNTLPGHEKLGTTSPVLNQTSQVCINKSPPRNVNSLKSLSPSIKPKSYILLWSNIVGIKLEQFT